MGVLAPHLCLLGGSAHPPINHMSAKSSSNIFPNPSEVLSKVLEPKDNKIPDFFRPGEGHPLIFSGFGILRFLLKRV